jgi:23S rRNA pseudouridine2605 synthase
MAEERLQKILSNFGYASRREAEEMILDGRVAVNGEVRHQLGGRADPEQDEITVEGVLVNRGATRYFMLNKPEGVYSTASDELGRETVLDMVPIGDVVLHPVGRLDADSQGLILLTNDGHLTQLLTHPSHEVEKEYLVGIDGVASKQDLQRLVRGITERGERLRASAVTRALPPPAAFGEDSPEAAMWLLVTLRQGKNREIRRLFTAIGRKVILLRRIRVGPLALGNLGLGSFRELTPEEVAALYETARRAAGGPPAARS